MAQDIFEQLHAAVKQAESQGKRYDEKGNLLTSPKGAQGEMQVMPKTARDPGYGVTPAQGKHPDELARVGKDYLKAMVDKYGDTQKALIAYNWGPKNTDDWLAKGADPKILPAETKNYVGKISKALGGDKVAPLAGAEPTESEKTMTKALGSGMSAENLVKDAGPGYKAAMAMMFLADDKPETSEDDIWKEAETPDVESYETPNALASLDLGYQSPFPAAKPTAAQQLAQFAQGGAVHRADGSPEYGEIATGGITDDTRTVMATPITARGALNALKEVGMDVGRGAVSNAESLVRGAVSQVPGVVGDMEKGGRQLLNWSFGPGGVKVSEQTYAPTSEEIRAATPRMTPTRQESAGMESLGEVMAPGLGKAAAPVAKAVGKEAARQMLRGIEGEGMLAPISPPILYAREPGKAMPGPIFSHLPSEEAPFVGRLDEYVANLPGPVQKQQFFGQLKGKFRDYEIGRAEEALKDLPDNAKLTPSDLLNRVKEVYDPGRYKTTVINPSTETRGSFYQGMDNPYYDKPTGIGPPLGVIHMTMETTPELEASQNAAQNVMEAFRRMMRSNADDKDMTAVNSFLESPKFNALPNAQEMRDKFQTGIAQHGKIKQYMDEVSNVDNMLRYPTLSNEYNALAEAAMEKYRGKMHWAEAYDKAKRDTHLALIEKANEWLKKNKYDPVDTRMLKNMPASQNPADNEEFVQAARNALDPAEQMIRKADRNLSQFLKEPVYAVNTALSADMPYTGQHTSLRGGNNPIAFSRFSEHTTTLPGMGEVKGIYVNELQSDMLDDLRKAGKRGGTKEQDLALAQQLDKDISALQQKQQDAIAAGKGPLAEDLDRQLMAAKQRKDIVSRRARMGTYDVPEIMHGMETSPQVVQQLMAKNAISAAIQRGDSFVAFPGKESAQAQLYEKLPHNLKQVVKDLGPGFEIRPIELEGPIGTMSHVGVAWGPEAAARIQKKGVPFATGGSVDKANIDHRKYL